MVVGLLGLQTNVMSAAVTEFKLLRGSAQIQSHLVEEGLAKEQVLDPRIARLEIALVILPEAQLDWFSMYNGSLVKSSNILF